MIKDKFLRGALILTLAGLAVKIIGSVNRILLSRLLGGEGIGLYQIAYPIYLLIISISAAGFPVAISILVARKVAQEDYWGANRIFKVSLCFMAVTGLSFALILYGAAGLLVEWQIIRDARAYLALVSLTPAVFFATILASFRGYFQGHQLMTPPAISQIIEQFVRVMTMLALAYYLLPRGLEYAAAGAAFGAVPGSITGLVVLSCFYVYYHKSWSQKFAAAKEAAIEPVGKIAWSLVRLAIPVSCANLMIPVVTGIDMLIVPSRLEVAGFTVVEATTAFGYLAGMALPLVMMATIPTTSLAASVVPAISEAHALGNKSAIGDKSYTAVRLCCLVTLPAAVGMWALATPISRLLYGTAAAGPSIANLAPSIFLLGLHQVTTGILQGLGMTLTPMLNMLFSALAKIFFAWNLTALPQYNIVGAAWASNLNFAVAAGLNIFFLMKYAKVSLPLKAGGRILLLSGIMGIVVALLYQRVLQPLLSLVPATLLAVIAAVVVYLLLLLLTGEIDKKQIYKLLQNRGK